MHSAILYYVVQAQAAELHRQAQHDAPARAATRARRARTARRGRRARGLPAMEALRVLTVRGGGSP